MPTATAAPTFSGLTVCILTIVALAICIIIGTKVKSNIGVLALIAASILGIFVFGMRASAIYTYWPTSIVLQMLIVTFFYGFANVTGTAKYLADWAIYAARKVPALLPVIFFVVDFAMMAIGINPGAVTVFLVPVFIKICYQSGVSEMIILTSHCLALGAGCTSPIGSIGIIAKGLFGIFGFEGQGGVLLPRIWLNFVLVGIICFIIVYFVFGGYKFKLHGEVTKPAPATPLIKKNLTLIIVCVLLFVVPMVLGKFIPFFSKISSGMDVLMVYSFGCFMAVLLGLGNEREVLKSEVPWSTILLVGGCATLIAVCSSMGLGTYLSGLVSNVSAPIIIPAALAVLAGAVSLVSDSTAVVFPLFFPMVAGIAASTGLSATKLFSCIMIGAILSGVAPISTGGSMLLSLVDKDRRNKIFGQLWIYCGCLLIVLALLALTPIIG